jgi:hypothetical protein
VTPAARQGTHQYNISPGGKYAFHTYSSFDRPPTTTLITLPEHETVRAEFLAILKYTLDLRLEGNRAPFMVGGHTALYPAIDPGRRRAIEEFIDYALSKPEVRFVTPLQLIGWMRGAAKAN